MCKYDFLSIFVTLFFFIYIEGEIYVENMKISTAENPLNLVSSYIFSRKFYYSAFCSENSDLSNLKWRIELSMRITKYKFDKIWNKWCGRIVLNFRLLKIYLKTTHAYKTCDKFWTPTPLFIVNLIIWWILKLVFPDFPHFPQFN